MALVRRGRRPPSVRDPGAIDGPRHYLFEDLFTCKYDESILDAARKWPSYPLPGWAREALEVHRRRDEYDVVVTWSERLALALMAVQRVASSKKPHIPLMYWFSKPNVRLPLLAFGSSVHAFITWSSFQREYAVEHLGLSPEKLYLVKHFVDQMFWSPRERETDMICSAGSEMRDYPTLMAALSGSGIPCHIASDHWRVARLGSARRIGAATLARTQGDLVTVGRKSPRDLRELYARSRFVVVPLRPSDTDNGVTVILEAMAMGKPVICTRTRGQVDVVQEGVTGIFVPPGDSTVLRTAILALYNEPERAAAMGRAARAYIEKHHALEKFCADVKAAIEASLDGHSAGPQGEVPD